MFSDVKGVNPLKGNQIQFMELNDKADARKVSKGVLPSLDFGWEK